MNRKAYTLLAFALLGSLMSVWFGCDVCPPDGETPLPPGEPGPAEYVGATACLACHRNLNESHERTGHAQALKHVEGVMPTYPAIDGAHPGIPSAPAGYEWTDIAYVIGGYTKAANFVHDSGYVMTDNTFDTLAQYNFEIPPIQSSEGFDSFLPEQAELLPYDYDCFKCHTTGPESLADNGGRQQDNRMGIEGTWVEDGVQCERCHGPGSLHLPDPSAGNIVVDGTSGTCMECHADQDDPFRIAAKDLFIVGNQQYGEVAASPHSNFSCTTCHDPHMSTKYDRADAIRNDCTACHVNVTMARHEGLVFQWGDYTEELTCESCHMPFAARNNNISTEVEFPGDVVTQFGDTRSHIMRIDVNANSVEDMFTADGTEVAVDEFGQAALVPCYVCQRCHSGQGNAFPLTPINGCAFGSGLHD